MRIVVLLLLLSCGVSAAQVTNAADFANAVLSSTPLAPGSLAVANYSPAAAAQSATVTLQPAGSSAAIPAQLTAINAQTVTFVIPPDVPPGDAILTLKPGDQATQWTTVSILSASLSLFRNTSSFAQNRQLAPLRAQNARADGSVVLNGLTTPAQPGQAVVLWGTGLGATPQSAVQITLGGVAQKVLYAGAAPGEPGIDQINFLVDAGTPDGCYVPLTVTYGGQSVSAYLSKTSDGLPCHHPLDLSAAAMSALDKGAGITTGEVTLSTAIQAAAADRASRQESASVIYPSLDASAIAAFVAPAALPAQPCTLVNPNFGANFTGGIFDPATGVNSATLTNGTVKLNVPWTSPTPQDAPLASLPPAILAGGKWTWSDPTFFGSSFDFTLPSAFQIGGGAPLSFDRTQDQAVKWNGNGYSPADTVSLTLTARYAGSPTLSCSVSAQSGSVVLPSALLSHFASGASGSLTVSLTPGNLPHAEGKTGSPSSGVTVPGTLPGSPALVIVLWTSTDSRPVDFK